MDKFLKEQRDKMGPELVKALEKRHFEAYYCPTKEDAKAKALSLIPDGAVVSWGGSMTLDETGIMAELRSGKYKVIDRDTAKSPEERMDLMRKAFTADTFITSVNGISKDGELVCIDGNGNRVAAIIFGPTNVIVVVGLNKVAPTVQEAMTRARNVAAPANAQRFDIHTPCIQTGQCADCLSPETICSYFVRIRTSRPPKKIKVILVGEDCGF